MEVIYREARQEECLELARGINATAGGILDFLYENLMPCFSTEQLVAQSLADGKRYDSYKSITVAECSGKVAGLVSSYPASCHGVDSAMKEFFPPERLAVLYNFYNSRVEDSYYLSAIFVSPRFRNQGIGSRLIDLTKEKARQQGYYQLSLLVLADNETALRVYRQNGFRPVQPVAIEEQPLIPHTKGALLLVSDI
ncbi:MAG: GNAT family N-acetyltransferase [Veillonellales bacterium]